MIAEQWRRVRQRAIWSWKGFAHVWTTEASLHQWTVSWSISVVVAFLLPLSAGERGLVIFGGFVVFALECLNTAIERVVDDVSEEWRDKAGQAKDAGSAAVALAGVGLGLAWVCILVGLLV